ELNPSTLDQDREIINSSRVIQRTLKKLIEKGLSPSSGSTYIRNPYKFYLTFILGIQEEKTIEDRLPANIRGNILHDLHQDLYTNYNSTLLWDLSIVKTSLEKSLLKYFPGSNISGHLLLEKKVIQKIANDWSQNEERRIKRKKEKGEKWKVSFVEEFLESSLELSNGKTIKIRGKADRIEECEKYWVIIDLKTGSFKKNDIQFTQWSDLLDRAKKKDKAFQLLMYTWLLSRQEKFQNIKKFKAGISSMRHPTKAISYLNWNGKADLEHKDLVDFENFVLVPLIESILNPEIPFRDTLEL
ncbi:MAG: RecB family exonuclease, partial [Schleiferiaceae bacterium]